MASSGRGLLIRTLPGYLASLSALESSLPTHTSAADIGAAAALSAVAPTATDTNAYTSNLPSSSLSHLSSLLTADLPSTYRGNSHVNAKHLFQPGQTSFMMACDRLSSMPAPPEGGLGEIAFAGRSNAGKSSLLNALTGSKVAKTSKTPGRTQTINFFRPGGKLGARCFVVDLPGYGFAKAPTRVVDRWNLLIGEYLRARSSCGQLRKVFLLMDSRRGFTTQDKKFAGFLNDSGIPFQVVLTKIDKLRAAELCESLYQVHSYLHAFSDADFHGDLLCLVSSKHKLGLASFADLVASQFAPEEAWLGVHPD